MNYKKPIPEKRAAMRGALKSVLFLGISLAVLLALTTSAEAYPEGATYYNFDALNDTGGPVNDLHVELQGVSQDKVSDYYTEDYENVEEGGDDDHTDIDWDTETDTDPGHTAHFGFALAAGESYSSMTVQWTLNGNIVPPGLPDVAPEWIQNVDLDELISRVHNRSTSPLWAQRRINTSTGPMSVNQLLVGGPLWNTGTIIDPTPILLPVCVPQDFPFDWSASTPNYVMMYEVYPDNGQGQPDTTKVLVRHLTAARAVPEPSTVLMLLGVGLVGLLMFVRRWHKK